MPTFLTHEPTAVVTMALADALDMVDFGVLLLSPDLQVRFINRVQREMWSLFLPPVSEPTSFRTLLRQVAERDLYPVDPDRMSEWIAQREDEVRQGNPPPRTIDLTDGRRLVLRCASTSDGGRMLTYVDETAWRECEEEQRRVHGETARRDAEAQFKTELLESQGVQLVALAEAAEETAAHAVAAKERLEQEMTERAHMIAELQRMNTIDPLTGLLNRAHFLKLAAELAQGARLRGHAVAVLMIDIDHFKSINDRYGHALGDRVLERVSGRLAAMVRPADVLGGLGGEEFGLVMPLASADVAIRIAERLRAYVADEPVIEGDCTINVTISVGLTMLQPCDEQGDAALARADIALYEAKRGGRNRVRVWAPELAHSITG